MPFIYRVFFRGFPEVHPVDLEFLAKIERYFLANLIPSSNFGERIVHGNGRLTAQNLNMANGNGRSPTNSIERLSTNLLAKSLC
jgi:hypothetical protein